MPDTATAAPTVTKQDTQTPAPAGPLLFNPADTAKFDTSTLKVDTKTKLTPLTKTSPVKPLNFDAIQVSNVKDLIKPLPGADKKKDRGADERLVAQFRVKIDDMEFDSSQGHLLIAKHPPHVWLHTRRHSEARFVLNDPDAKIFEKLKDAQTVEVEIGFNNGYRVNKFSGGKIYKYGRMPPDGTIVVAVDAAIALQQQSGSSATNTAATPDSQNKVEDTSSGGTVKETHNWGASFYGKTDGFDGKKTANGEIFDSSKMTCAHKTLAFGTQIRVTYNGKSVVVRVNDRGPYVAGRDIDLSYGAAEKIGLVAAGHGTVKAEIMAPNTSGNTSKPTSNTATPPATPKADEKKTTNPIKPITTAPTTNPTPAQDNSKALPIPANNTPQTNSTQKQGTDFFGEIKNNSQKKATTPAEQFVLGTTNLKFAKNTKFDTSSQGTSNLQQSKARVASLEAALRGDVIIVRGNTVTETSAQPPTSEVILDFESNPSIFISKPVVFKRTALQMQSAIGATTVAGFNIGEKSAVGVTVVNPNDPAIDPNKVINPPEWSSLKMGDPIIPGGVYTWGDATRNGSRVPESKEIVKNIIKVAQVLEQFTKKLGKGKWRIASWYRDPKTNAATPGAAVNSEHMSGHALDIEPPDFINYFLKEIVPNWPGGAGLDEDGGYFHIDMGPRGRWDYHGEMKKYGYK